MDAKKLKWDKMESINRRKFVDITSKGLIIGTLMPSFILVGKNSGAATSNNILIENNSNNWVNYFAEFTEVYKKYNNNIYQRELECLKLQFPRQMCKIQSQDLLAGRIDLLPIGFTPQSDSGGFGYYIHTGKTSALLKDSELTLENKERLKVISDFWKKEDNAYKTREAYSAEMKRILPSDNWNAESGIAFPLYRMSGVYPDIKKLVNFGLPGLKSEIQKKAKNVTGDTLELYKAMTGMLEVVADLCNRFAEMAAQQAIETGNESRKKELKDIESRLRNIATKKPATFKEAVQLAFLYSQFSGTFNYGRYDDVFGEFYVRDIKNGILSNEEAVHFIESLFNIINDRGNVFDSRVFVGGKGREHEEAADQLALILMQAHHNLKNVTPQFSFRFYEGQNPALWEKALDMIGDGCTYPIMYNDDVNIPAVQHAFNLPYKEAQHYLPFGCGEYVINHKSVGTPSGVINLLQALEVALNKGVNPTTNKKMGIPGLKNIKYDSFSTLWETYKKQVEYHVDQLAKQEELEYKIAGQIAPYLMYSILFDDCVERGKPIFARGVRYLGGTLETYGNTNTADSLTAIKKLVFKEKRFSMDEMMKMMDLDFNGFEKERKWMLEAPKFGNDDDIADDMLVKVDHHVFNAVRNQRLKTGLYSYLVVNINNNANTVMGRYTAASPDGRKAFTFMANANAPTGGMDRNGITAMMNSMVKPDPGLHAGMVQNMKFTKNLFKEKRPVVDAVLKTYFEKGGTQCMINVLGREDLEMALKEPEKYANLIVRVGGYSAKFVDLPKDVQQEILSRTLY